MKKLIIAITMLIFVESAHAGANGSYCKRVSLDVAKGLGMRSSGTPASEILMLHTDSFVRTAFREAFKEPATWKSHENIAFYAMLVYAACLQENSR